MVVKAHLIVNTPLSKVRTIVEQTKVYYTISNRTLKLQINMALELSLMNSQDLEDWINGDFNSTSPRLNPLWSTQHSPKSTELLTGAAAQESQRSHHPLSESHQQRY
jgi:hypothetical protein